MLSVSLGLTKNDLFYQLNDLCVQILQANPLMETERKLFVYFFTNPSKLRQVVSELAHRIDALATANTVTDTS